MQALSTAPRLIARTETRYSQNRSSMAAYHASDAVVGAKAWDNQTGYDDEDCTQRNQRIYTLEEADQLVESEHPNGTLKFAPEIAENFTPDA